MEPWPFYEAMRQYLQRYSSEMIRVSREIQAKTSPAWARCGTFWFQHDGYFDDSLALSTMWDDGEGSVKVIDGDPIREIETDPWSFWDDYDIPESEANPDDVVTGLIAEWLHDCWIRSGGRASKLRFYLYAYYGHCYHDLLKGRLVGPDEMRADLKL